MKRIKKKSAGALRVAWTTRLLFLITLPSFSTPHRETVRLFFPLVIYSLLSSQISFLVTSHLVFLSLCLPKLKIATTDTSNQVSLDRRWGCAHLCPLTILSAHCLPLKYLQRCCVCLLHIAVLCLIIHYYQIIQAKQWQKLLFGGFRGAVLIQPSSRWRHRTAHPRQDSAVSVNARDDYLSEQGRAGSSFVFFVYIYIYIYFYVLSSLSGLLDRTQICHIRLFRRSEACVWRGADE